MSSKSALTRRSLMKKTAVAAVSAAAISALGTNFAHAAGSERIRVGVIGCGGRGTGAAKDAVSAAGNVQIVALGDVFKDRVDGCRSQLAELGAEKVQLSDERCFTGFDAYQKVIASDCDMVILATPPGFRPAHLKAAVEAGKHVFMEKPVAVDAPGVRVVLESAELARKKDLGIVAGTQRRHEAGYIETIKRIHDGEIGDVLAAQIYWNQGGLWSHDRKPEWSDMEWQLRNWLYFAWLSGDHIVEQHVHNIDVMNWVFASVPTSAYGMGGRQARVDPKFGHIYDHFAIEYTYPGGAKVMSMCRQIDNNDNRIGEHVVGTRGTSNCANWIKGETAWKFDRKGLPSPYVQEHMDLIESIRAGQPINEARRVAESTLAAIMGRMSAYTGKEVTWEQALKSKQSLAPAKLEMGPIAVPAVPMPGKEKLV